MLLPGKKILAPDKSLKVPWLVKCSIFTVVALSRLPDQPGAELVKCSIFTVVALANGVTPSAENDDPATDARFAMIFLASGS